MRLVLAGLLAVPLLLAAAPVRAQVESREGILLQNQILELKRDVQALRDQIASGSGGSSLGSGRSAPPPSQGAGDITAALLERVSRLEDEVRNLRGHVDEVDNARQRQGDDLAKQIQDLNFKIDNAATTTPAAPASSRAPATTPATTSEPPHALNAPTNPGRRTPELALQQGSAALARRDYAGAEAAAREVLAVPKTPRAIEAQFLLAEALAGKRDYAAAAVAFDDSYNRARTGAHAQDSLLGLANALSTLGEKRAACATLDKLKAEFPTPRPDLKGSITTVRQQAGCR
jgi:TolA-binding protein